MTQPTSCPACGAKVTSMSTDGFREFACGKMQRISDGVYGSMCHNAEDAAVSLRRERDEARAQVKMFSDNEGGALTFHILRTWGREKLERFCLHLLGDDWQTLTARAEKAEGERDDARVALSTMTKKTHGTLAEIIRFHHDMQEQRISELSEPMACGHYGANRQPDDDDGLSREYCVVCAYLDTKDEDASVERNALMARLAELQAVCDAAIVVTEECSDSYSVTDGTYRVEPVMFQDLINAVNNLQLAALASGAESEVTK